MKQFKEIWNNSSKLARTLFWILMIVGVIFMITSFILPPLGIIDNSVLTAFGLIQTFSSIGVGLSCIEEGLNLKFSHGNSEVEISKSEVK